MTNRDKSHRDRGYPYEKYDFSTPNIGIFLDSHVIIFMSSDNEAQRNPDLKHLVH